jgi:precorrin-2 dehydrogenase
MPRADAVSLFPIFLKLEERRCLVVGAGAVAESKIESLVAAGAMVHVVAPRASEAVAGLARARKISWSPRRFKPADLGGVFLVVVATADRALNECVFREARKRRVLTNVVDDPPRCDFYYPSVVRRGNLQIAISTSGHSPALAQRLKHDLEQQFPAEYAGWLEHLGRKRQKLFAKTMDGERRRRLLHRLATLEQFEAFTRGAPRKAGGSRAG